jgi:hypothetical protein
MQYAYFKESTTVLVRLQDASVWQFLHFAITDTASVPEPMNAVSHGATAMRPQTMAADSRRVRCPSG